MLLLLLLLGPCVLGQLGGSRLGGDPDWDDLDLDLDLDIVRTRGGFCTFCCLFWASGLTLLFVRAGGAAEDPPAGEEHSGEGKVTSVTSQLRRE